MCLVFNIAHDRRLRKRKRQSGDPVILMNGINRTWVYGRRAKLKKIVGLTYMKLKFAGDCACASVSAGH